MAVVYYATERPYSCRADNTRCGLSVKVARHKVKVGFDYSGYLVLFRAFVS